MSNLKRGNYAEHARIWGLEKLDRSGEINFYSTVAKKYGRRILSLMCAAGEIARGMAENGLEITAVDIEPEMIAAAKKNSPEETNPLFLVGDVTDFNLPGKDYDFAFIGGSADFHHLLSEEEMLSALKSISRHLVNKGGLVLELEYPRNESRHSPVQRFDLAIPPETGIKAWKFGETAYNAENMLMHIKQEVFIEENGVTESFIHEFDFQLIDRETLNRLMDKAGFQIVREYGGYDFSKWHPKSEKWIIEAKKVEPVTL